MRFFPLTSYFRLLIICIFSGIICGFSAWVLSYLLNWAIFTRQTHESLVYFLPLGGFVIGWIYYKFGQTVSGGTDLIIEEILDPKKIIPTRMAPFVLITTVFTHLLGGPSGREGSAVQMGVSISDRFQHFFKLSIEERKILLIAAAGASFGAILGAPWAGTIFGMEVITIGRFKPHYFFECAVTSFVAFLTIKMLHLHDFANQYFEIPPISLKILFFVALSGIIFGLTSQIFVKARNFFSNTLEKFISYPPLRTLFGGILLVILFSLEGTHKFKSLGISHIKDAFIFPENFKTPSLKLLFSSLTIGSGFKGGEFIPLVFIGSTLGSALSYFFPISFQLLAAVGFSAVFAAAANAPLTLTIATIEIFGLGIAPYAFLACYMSYYFSGHSGIFSSQKTNIKKHQRLLIILRWFGELPEKFFKK